MSKIYIKSISIEGFRGINNENDPLKIPFNHNGVTSFFAENGMGKSSIYEALYYCINGYLPKFDDLHRDIRDDKTKKNLFHSNNGKIEIIFINDNNIETKIEFEVNDRGDRNIIYSSIPDPQIFLDSIYSDQNFLDYNTFIQILIKSPEETGKLFSELVGFSGFPFIKNKIDKIARTQNINTDFQKSFKEKEIDDSKKRIEELKIKILNILNDLGNPLVTFNINELKKIVKKLIYVEFKTKVKDINQTKFDQLIKNIAGDSYDKNVAELNSIENEKNEVLKYEQAIKLIRKTHFIKFNNKLKKAYSKFGSEKDLYIGELLDKAIPVYDKLDDFNKNTCVLCNTEDLGTNENSFYDLLSLRIKKYKNLKNELDNIKSEFKNVIENLKLLEVENYLSTNDLIMQGDKFFSKAFYDIQDLSRDFFSTQPIYNLIKNYKNLLLEKSKKITKEIKVLSLKVPKELPILIEKNIKLKEIVDGIIEIQEKSNRIAYIEKYLTHLENWLSFINNVKTDFEDSFNDLMSDISSDIDKLSKEFFFSIMKNSDIVPLIKKDRRGHKINFLIEKFYTIHNENNATPLLSESYRNALCLSIYFASALKRNSTSNFIVLDDITSSFDSGHQFYLLELIKDKISRILNKKGKQIIILTHDGMLKKTLNTYSNNYKYWDHYSLVGTKDKIDLKEFSCNDFKKTLLGKINRGDSLGSDLRSYYEFVMLDIIEKLDIPVPYNLILNRDKKLVDNLLKSVNEIIQLRLSAKKRSIKNLPSITDFKSFVQQISNNLSHIEMAISSSISKPVLISYVDYIDSIKQRFQYECKCSKKQGWVYFKSLNGNKRNNQCICKI